MSNGLIAMPAAEDEAACLLQNQFAAGDVAVEEDQASIKLHGAVEPTSLFEAESFEVANMMHVKQRSIARSKSCMAHLALLDRKTRILQISRNVTDKKLDELVDSFINHQSGSTDACSSQLLEAKHQLNQIHQYVIDLSMEVNSTERAILALDKELQAVMKQMEDLENWKTEELAKCEKQTQEAIAMFGKLSEEMKEMKEIASPGVAMNIHTGTIETSELQTSVSIALHKAEPEVVLATSGKHRNATADLKRLEVLVQGTQDATSKYLQCMGPQKHPQAALLAAAVSKGKGKKKPFREVLSWTKGAVNKMCPGKVIGELTKGKYKIKECKKKCEKMKGCNGFNRGKKGEIEAKCWFFGSCNVDTPKSKLATNPMFNVYFISSQAVFGKNRMANRMGVKKDKIEEEELPLPLDDSELPPQPLDDETLDDAELPAKAEAPLSGDPGAAEGEGEAEGEGPTAEECEAEKENLHTVYVKTYVELSRLKNEYDQLANSTACKDGVMSQYEAQKVPLQQQIDELLKAIDKKVKKLQSLRPRLESANDAEKKMRDQVKKIAAECGELPETISDLGKVRDTIQALSRCPGLSRVQFHLPKWEGSWVTFKQDAATMGDKKQDDLMDAACDKQFAGSRAAEVGEIEEQSVLGIPLTNTAEAPLIGACPMCEGDEGASYVDKHARLCWQPGKELNHKDKSTNCGKGLKAILCVQDQGDIRNIPR